MNNTDRTEIISLYTSMMDSVISKMDELFIDGKLDSDTYSGIIGQNSCEFMKVAAATVQSFAQLNSDIEYKNAQVLLIKSQTDNSKLEGINLTKQGKLLEAQIDHQNKQIEVLDTEIKKAEAQLKIINAEVVTATKQIEVLNAQIDLQKEQILSAKVERDKQGLVMKQLDLQNTSITLAMPKISNENLISKEQLNLLINNVAKSAKDIIATQSAIDKSNQEIAVLKAKEKTELANTMKSFTNDSLIGKQANLYDNQALSYVNSNKLAVTKVFTDTWNTSKMVDSGLTTTDTKLNNKNIGKVVSELTKTAFTNINLE